MPKVRIYLWTPVAFWGSRPVRPLMFDGLLAYLELLRRGIQKDPSELTTENLLEVGLPLERDGRGPMWHWRASAMFVPPEARVESMVFMRRYDWPEFAVRAGLARSPLYPKARSLRCEERSGWARAYQEPYWLLVTPYIDFYFDGDVNAVADLMRVLLRVGHIGSKRHAGYGRVRKVEIDRRSEDWAVWREGVPTRPVPVEVAGERPGLSVEWWSYRPPYWHYGRKALCYVPPREQWWPVRDFAVGNLADAVEAYLAEVTPDRRHSSAPDS